MKRYRNVRDHEHRMLTMLPNAPHDQSTDFQWLDNTNSSHTDVLAFAVDKLHLNDSKRKISTHTKSREKNVRREVLVTGLYMSSKYLKLKYGGYGYTLWLLAEKMNTKTKSWNDERVSLFRLHISFHMKTNALHCAFEMFMHFSRSSKFT